MKKSTAFFVVFVMIIVSGAFATDLNFSTTNLGLTLPDSYTTGEESGVLWAVSADAEVMVFVLSAGDEAMFSFGKEAIQQAVLDVLFIDFKIETENKTSYSDMTTYEVTGTGKFAGDPVTSRTLLIMCEVGYAYIVFIVKEGKWDNKEQEINDISSSIHSLSQ